MDGREKSRSVWRRIVVLAMCLALVASAVALVTGCSGGGSNGGSDATAAIDTKTLTDGTWECTGAVSTADGKTYELHDVLNAYVMSMNFYDDECRIYVDTDFTIVKWELSGDDITLSGDGTYHLTVADGGNKLVWKDFEGTGYDLEFVKK